MEIRNQLTPAKLGMRAFAAILDSLLATGVWYLIISMWGHTDSEGALTSATVSGDKVLTGGPALLLMLGTAAYWIVPEWLAGLTIGKLICGLRVVRPDGRSISLGQSLKRNLLRALDFFPFYLTGFFAAKLTPNRQRLGDLWAGTIVVSATQLTRKVHSAEANSAAESAKNLEG
ncbi:MAG: RDD family protein [Acidobacteria bacterium]|nr:RDD family protein [Acidobacteriota bacterium]MBS1867542.1 RDD family protein [Acidobacteriota bacterium]